MELDKDMSNTSDYKIKIYARENIDSLPQFKELSKEKQLELKVVSTILPFKVNNYVVDHLIDWDHFEKDPIFHLNFMQRKMISEENFSLMADALNKSDDNISTDVIKLANKIRMELNPHPSGQLTANVPKHEGTEVPGLQHKYSQTVLIFPKQGQTCHSYCTFCFRWPQFSKMDGFKFETDQARLFLEYLKEHREVTDVLITGGDPMVMHARILKTFIEPLLGPEFSHIQNIRIGSKSISYWPYRYLTDKDSGDVLRLFEKVSEAKKTLAFMAHVNHFKEIEGEVPQRAIKAIQNTGAIIRTQSPLLRHINDTPEVWAKNWNLQVRLGVVPYYMFVERDTGPQNYFAISLQKASQIYKEAINMVSGLARTARGPSMSAFPGKVAVEDVQVINGEKVFILKMLQARNPDWVGKPFFAKFDPFANWLTDLKPAFGERKFFFEDDSQDEENLKQVNQ